MMIFIITQPWRYSMSHVVTCTSIWSLSICFCFLDFGNFTYKLVGQCWNPRTKVMLPCICPFVMMIPILQFCFWIILKISKLTIFWSSSSLCDSFWFSDHKLMCRCQLDLKVINPELIAPGMKTSHIHSMIITPLSWRVSLTALQVGSRLTIAVERWCYGIIRRLLMELFRDINSASLEWCWLFSSLYRSWH